MVDNAQIEFPFFMVVESVVDLVSNDIGVQCVIKVDWHDAIEGRKKLVFDCTWLYQSDGSIKHVLQCS